MCKFGVAGFPVNFFSSSYRKQRDQIFIWLREQNLDWLELQCTYGVRMPQEQAIEYKRLATQFGIELSIHGPYFISLASQGIEIQKRSVQRIQQSFQLAEWVHSKRVIFHPGAGYPPDNRIVGVKQIIRLLNEIKPDLPLNTGICLYPEIGGRIVQLGSLDEIIQLCESVDYARPCLDLAHLHARTNGSLINTEAIIKVFDRVESCLGRSTLEECHIHMYPVAYNHNGEEGHRAFDDPSGYFYPRADHFIAAIRHKRISPVVICEAKNTQEIGAILMKQLYSENHNDTRSYT